MVHHHYIILKLKYPVPHTFIFTTFSLKLSHRKPLINLLKDSRFLGINVICTTVEMASIYHNYIQYASIQEENLERYWIEKR